MLEKGAQVGNYIVEGEIGGGGMAQLYRVRHAVLGTLHALKVLDAAFREKPEVRARFLSEGMIAARLNHPNVVKVTDTVSTTDVAGLVMELVQGPNLEQYLRGLAQPPSGSEIRALFLPILDAVGEAHRRGVIHRDIKPANILLEARSTGLVPKITDFGIAKLSDGAISARKAATNADARMGTLSYMSPEQIRGAREVTARSDIFSLGATLYEMATCSVAFDGQSDYDIMHKIVQGIHAPAELVPGIDPAIAAAIRRALAPDPELRFATCEEFMQALGGVSSVAWSSMTRAPSSSLEPPRVAQRQAAPLVANVLDDIERSVAANPYSPPLERGSLALVSPSELILAERSSRVGAVLLDLLLSSVACIPIGASPLFGVTVVASLWIFQWYLLATTGQTIGKKWLGIRIVKMDGSRVDFVSGVLLRYWLFGALLLIPFLNFLLGAVDVAMLLADDRRCLHDQVAGTQVIRDPESLSAPA